MKIKKGFVVREVGGENVAVPVGEQAKTFRGMIKLNETGRFLWDFFATDKTVDEAVAAMLETYDVDEATAREDAERFVNVLLENGFAE
jgi:hypothetical protein